MTRRWNGWGDEAVVEPIPPAAMAMLERLLGPGRPQQDADLAAVVGVTPASRIAGSAELSTEPEDRVRHARGQSLGDWIALRSGRVGRVPDAVARPQSSDEIRALFRLATNTGARLVPYGGGTSVVGGLSPAELGAPRLGERPTVIVDLERLVGLRSFDERSGLATFGAGTTGPALEATLRDRRAILGHEPQSFELSTLGGWVVARSSGQRSLGFGGIEALFAGGRLEAPAGTIELRPLPASAAGPDLRQLVLGSEGRLGILAEAMVRTAPLPQFERTVAVFLPDWEHALRAVHELAGARLPLSMIRLSSALETDTTLALSGRDREVGLLRRWLGFRGVDGAACLLLYGLAGRTRVAEAASGEAMRISRARGGVGGPGAFGRAWDRSRFRAPYLRNALWDAGYAVDTIEAAIDWSGAPTLAAGLGQVLGNGLVAEGERVLVLAHLSHVHVSGTSLSLTCLFRLADDPEVTFRRWRTLVDVASRTIVEHGGTISHPHSVGRDHAPYPEAERGELAMAPLRGAISGFDPSGIMDPGVPL